VNGTVGFISVAEAPVYFDDVVVETPSAWRRQRFALHRALTCGWAPGAVFVLGEVSAAQPVVCGSFDLVRLDNGEARKRELQSHTARGS
jgi:hypothetical protein